MAPRRLLVSLLTLSLLVSGCTQAPTQAPVAPSTPRATTAPITPAPAATPVAATPAPAAAPVAATPDSAQGLGAGILNCAKGTPWEYSQAASTGQWKVTYTIEGKTPYKGGDYCKVVGRVEAAGAALPPGYSWDYYFKADPSGATYSDIWYVFTYPGAPSQEVHVTAGVGGATVTGGGTTGAGATAAAGSSPAAGEGGIIGGPGAAGTAAGTECLKLLTLQEVQQLYPIPQGADWSLTTVEAKVEERGAHHSDPVAYKKDPLSTASFVKVSFLNCKYGAIGLIVKGEGTSNANNVEFIVNRYPAGSTTAKETFTSELCIDLYGKALHPPELGGPSSSCLRSSAMHVRVLKDATVFSVSCGGSSPSPKCTQDQLISLTKLILGRL